MKSKYIFIGLLSFSIFSCTEEVEIRDITEKETEVKDTTVEITNDIVYSIPSPNDQFELLKLIGGEANTAVVHDLEKQGDYITSDKQALNFGVYSADAGYLTCFGNSSNFVKYLTTLESLGNKIGVSQIYGADMLEQAEKFESTPDSLFHLSGDAYAKIYDKMLENGKGEELSLILAGGWVETMQMLFVSAGEFGSNSDIDQAIVDQRLSLENLLAFSAEYTSNPVMDQLKEVMATYESLEVEVAETSVNKTDSGKLVFDGGDQVSLDEETFNTLKSQIEELRTEITK